jgi:3-isopropylmalate dehydrogenase
MDAANPIATVLSAAMMLKYSFKLHEEARVIEDAVIKALNMGLRTGDIMSDGMTRIGCKEMGRVIAGNIG